VRAWYARRLKHLVVGAVELIIPEGRPKQRAGWLGYSHGSLEASDSTTSVRHP
jgi:hypothetical protein